MTSSSSQSGRHRVPTRIGREGSVARLSSASGRRLASAPTHVAPPAAVPASRVSARSSLPTAMKVADRRRRATSTRFPATATILLLEDDDSDAFILRNYLEDAFEPGNIRRARSISEGRELLSQQFASVILVDLSLTDSRGLDTLTQVRLAAPESAIIVYSGVDDESVTTDAARAGAQDYLIKGEVSAQALRRSIRYALQTKRSERRLAYLAYHDQLTGLANRVLFRERTSRSMASVDREAGSLALLLVDLDGFKKVNDTYGHEAGDTLLVEISKRLVDAARTTDVVARLGGDEFAIVVCGNARIEDVLLVAERIQQVARQPVTYRNQTLAVGCSIGVAFYPDHGPTLDDVVRRADIALYRAKAASREKIQLFDAQAHRDALEDRNYRAALRAALNNREFVVHYQPQWDLTSCQMVGVEALLRWRHPQKSIILPSQFVPLLEEMELISSVGAWVFESACRQAQRWRLAIKRDFRLAVNVAAQQIKPELCQVLRDVLAATEFPPELLEIEITETATLDDVGEVKGVLATVRSLGVRVAIDDFGVGYAGLRHLREFPVDALKIDRSFLSDVTRSTADACIVANVISLAHSLGLEVVAEGIENLDQLNFIRSHRCNIAQGFLLSRPQCVEDISHWMTKSGWQFPTPDAFRSNIT